MKKNIKIGLLAFLVLIIGGFVYLNADDSGSDLDSDIEIPDTKNVHIQKINTDIGELSNMSPNQFSKSSYKDILYRIEEAHEQRLLGTSVSDNLRWKKILMKNLFSRYVTQFLKESMYVFENNTWKVDKVKFINKEHKVLKASEYMDANSDIATKLNKISAILTKYYEINKFLIDCNAFKHEIYSIDEQYPDVSDKLNKAKRYLNNKLDNRYVNNCTRIKDKLKKIPDVMYQKHIKYLDNKLLFRLGESWKNYPNQREYAEKLYKPLEEQLLLLEDDVYGVSYDDDLEALLKKLSNNANDAHTYYKANPQND